MAYAGLGKAYLTGFQQFDKGKQWVANASANCERALSLSPELLEGHICLGNIFNGTGKYDKAVEEFQGALRSEPSSEDALRGLADAYTNLGNFAAAESTYKKAIALRPNYWGVYTWLGFFYYNQARYPEAAQMFLKATQLAPDNYRGYLALGGTYCLEGRYSDAIEALKRSVELRPSPDAYNNLGYVYTLLHRYPEAITALEQALKIDNSDWMNWGNLGDALYWSPDRRVQASAKYKQAATIGSARLQINPRDTDTLAYLANYSAMLEDRQAAFGYLQKALELAPSRGEVLFRAAIVYNHFGQTDQALAYLTKAVEVGYSRTIIRDTPDFQGLQQNAQFRTLADVSPPRQR